MSKLILPLTFRDFYVIFTGQFVLIPVNIIETKKKKKSEYFTFVN